MSAITQTNSVIIPLDHIVGLDGRDGGPAAVEIGPSGEIIAVRPVPPGVRSAGDPELTAIPLLADAHAHLAISDGVTEDPAFHTLANVDAQLRHLALRGIGHVHSLGTDQPWLYERLRRRLASGDAGEKAFGYSAGIGFGARDGWPPDLTRPEPRFRPTEPDTARAHVRALADLGCRTLKVWVDDLGGRVPRIPPPVVETILDEARACGIVTFAHVHFHADAEELVAQGIAVLAHSIRDRIMDADLIARIGEAGVTLIPTLFREEAEMAFSLADNPYLQDTFFLTSEAELVPRLRGLRFSDDAESPRRRLEIAQENLSRAHAAGIAIALGTDGGFRMKPQGFAQHRELQLLNGAGLSPRSCLRAALEVNRAIFASGMTAIEAGQPASFFVVEGDPVSDIRVTERVREVWVCGKAIVRTHRKDATSDEPSINHRTRID